MNNMKQQVKIVQIGEAFGLAFGMLSESQYTLSEFEQMDKALEEVKKLTIPVVSKCLHPYFK